MKKQRKLLNHLFFLITLGLFFSLSFAFFYFSNGINIKTLLKTEVANIKTTPKAATKPSELQGWIAWWDEKKALESLNTSSQQLTSISPVWYRINNQGNLETIPHSLEPALKEVASQQNIKVIPTITNDFDPNRVRNIINNSDFTAKFSEDLANLAQSQNYQGFDIDWEEINPKDQPAFTIFIQKLADFLHTYNLVLTVSVHPQTGKSSDRAVAQGYNFEELSKSADALKIMAYDIHNKNSEAGAITPARELNLILEYTSVHIPIDKIILGLPTYGYDWEAGSKKAAAVTFSEAVTKIKDNGGSTHRDPESNSLIGEYIINNIKHVIWFEDAQTLQNFINKARSFGIYKFSFWRIGAEDTSFWKK